MPSSHLTKAPPTFDLQFRQPAEQPGIEREDIPSPSFKSACSFLLVKGFRCEGWILTFYSFILALFNKSSSIANNNFTHSFCLLYKENQNLGQCYHFLQYCMLVIYIDVLGFLHVHTFGKKKTLPKSQRTQGFSDLEESIYENDSTNSDAV